MMQREQILEFLDGALDPAAEQELFEMLAGHSELRSTLRDYVQISDAVRCDREAFAPPATVEAALMRQLGFVPTPPATMRTGGWLALLLGSRVFGLVASFVLGALLVLTALQVIADGPDPSHRGGPPSHPTSPPGEAAPSFGASSPKVSHTVVGNAVTSAIRHDPPHKGSPDHGRVVASAPSNAPIAQRINPSATGGNRARFGNGRGGGVGTDPFPDAPLALARNEQTESIGSSPDTNHMTSTSPEARLFAASVVELPLVIDVQVRRPSATIDYRHIDGSTSLVQLPDIGRDRGPLVVEVRRTVAMDLVNVDAREADASLFEESTLGGYLRLTPSLAVGAEIGIERYAQRIPFAEGDTVYIDQRPLCLWGGAALRVYPGEFAGLAPVVQGGIGMSGSGPIAHGRVGLAREILAGLRLGAGLEISTLFYNAAGKGQMSGRWGGYGGLEVTLPW